MDDIITTLSLDFNQNRSLQSVNLKQFDDSLRKIKIKLYHNGNAVTLSSGDVATLYAEVGGVATAIAKSCDIADNQVIVLLDSAMTALSGIEHCEVKIQNTNGKVSTATFNLNIEKNVVTASTPKIISTADIFNRLEFMDNENFNTFTEHTKNVHANYTLNQIDVDISSDNPEYSYAISKSSYTMGQDGLTVWVNDKILKSNEDYVVAEAGTTLYEIQFLDGVKKGDHIVIQIWGQPPTSSANSNIGSSYPLTSGLSQSIVGQATDIEEV